MVKNRKSRIALLAAAVVLALVIGCCIYAGNCEQLVFAPEEPKAGLIFYPGGNVEYTAYSGLMGELAKADILCVLVEMPFDLAVLDVDAAEGIQAQFPQVERWYLAGHSLGGSMAASYGAEHAEDYEGLILLASYSTADLRESGLEVLSIYGDRDGVLNRERYEANWANLPQSTEELVIDGGNHANFGFYGPQKGDGEAAITGQEQQDITAAAIRELIFGE